ncbi:MAG: CpaF family protein [Deltaproteobacteria bacterium]|nr:CpaF family protein [Deltaproteobacteria bacterium]
MINGPEDVWIERKGRLHKTDARFTEQGLLAAARNMAQFVGRTLTEERARLDARLPDGSRIHIVLAPVARRGTTISIRKFSTSFLTAEQLIESGSWTPECARFVAACVICKKNLIVAGGTGSGKTTLLNVLSTFIPDDERILTIEDSAELQLAQAHLVPFEARPADQYGKGAVTIQDLLHSALRLRPDRIIVGEVRGGECFDMLQALNTGHGGSMSTVHANSPVESLSRLESLTLLSGVDLPLRAVRAQVAAAIHVVVCCARYADGGRRISHVSEVLPLDDRGDYRVRDLFVFTETGRDAEGNVLGTLSPTGLQPTFLPKLLTGGFEDFTQAYFQPATYGYPPPPFFSGR